VIGVRDKLLKAGEVPAVWVVLKPLPFDLLVRLQIFRPREREADVLASRESLEGTL